MPEIKPLESVDPEFASLLLQVVQGSIPVVIQNGRVFYHWYNASGELRCGREVFANDAIQGRNEPCLCGSGKKYKRCCGQV